MVHTKKSEWSTQKNPNGPHKKSEWSTQKNQKGPHKQGASDAPCKTACGQKENLNLAYSAHKEMAGF